MEIRQLEAMKVTVNKDLADATLWTKLWSGVHHGFLFGGAILSASAAVLLQIKPEQTLLATVLAGTAALTTTLAASGGFERKWKANRLIKVRLLQLEIDLLNPGVKPDSIRQALKDLYEIRYYGIVGADQTTDSRGSGTA
jgi:hypothetical protein